MFRTALSNVLAHKARLLMTTLAVMLGVAFVSGTLVFTDTFGNAYKNKTAKSFDHVSVAIRPDGDSSSQGDGSRKPSHLTDNLLKRAATLPGAEYAIGVVNGFTALADKDGKLVGGEWGATGSNYYPGKGGKDPRYAFTEGAAPKSAADIALDSRTAERTGFKVGDTVRYSTDGHVRTARVSGIFDTGDGSVVAGGSLVVLDNQTALKVLNKSEYDEIDVKAAAGTSESKLKSFVEKILPKRTDAVTGDQLSDDQERMIERQTGAMSHVLLTFAGIALFVGIFIIANTFTMLVGQRTKELALMRAVGASRCQVTCSVLTEAFLVGLVAAVAGFGLGLCISASLEILMDSDDASLPKGPIVIAPTTILVTLLMGVGVTMLAAWLPGRRAAKIPPVAAMNSVHATPATRGLLVRNTIGSLFVALGVVLLLMDDIYTMAAGAGTICVGVIVLTPLLSRPFIAASAPLLKPFGVTGKLSRLNSVRNPRRTASTAAALMIGLTLITAMTVIATSMSSAINKMAADSLKADYSVSMPNSKLAPEIREKIDKLPDVEVSSPLRSATAEADGSHSKINGVEPKSFGKLVSLDFTSGSVNGLKMGTALVDTDTAKEESLKTGDTLPLKFDADGKTIRLKVAGVYKGNALFNGIFASTSVIDPHLSKLLDDQVLVKTKGGASDRAEKAIVDALGSPAITVQDKDDISNAVAGAISLILNMLYGLLAMAILIAVLGVINTLAMSVFERKHEIGMLLAIGLDRAKVKQMVRLEAVVISLFGAVLGIGLGLFMGWATGGSIAEKIKTYSTEIPVGRIVIFLATAVVVGVIAAVWPARSAARLNPLTAIKSE
ncbi:ABC transporter permease [Streptomyces zagrosensis]|uniref:Putative ABC transport system permease protein n=1 Tax=Streptomyces zagrosensis TaxID=1042984 RepID=A0A7W9QCG8_9ACTN|nr:FtsX-like permease family protein [Streptomyces zagrosensis]MBB5937640.1 putative ABC transport system permease protein [Streptomyces zagrosensis]